jgi:MFS transporter, PPP family, 3-phenylpropionic acid transporter
MKKSSIIKILYFLLFCCAASYQPLFADFFTKRGITGTKISFLLSIAPIMLFVVQPILGIVADNFGYKKTLLVSAFICSISFLGYLHDGGYYWLILVTILMAIFFNSVQPIVDSLALQVTDEEANFSYGTLRFYGAAGWSITSIISGLAKDQINFTAIFIISFISMGLVFLFSFFMKIEPNKKVVLESNSFKNLTEVLKNKELLFLFLCVFLVAVGATTIWNFYNDYMLQNGASSTLVGFGLGFQGICELPLFYFSARIIRRLGLKQTLVITVMATVLRLILYSIVKNPYVAIPIEMLHGFSWSLFWVACVEYVNKLIPINWRSTGQSILFAVYSGAGAIVGNYWTGYCTAQKMKISEIFLLNAGLVFVVVVLVVFFMKSKE